jgi:hypothetical protein
LHVSVNTPHWARAFAKLGHEVRLIGLDVHSLSKVPYWGFRCCLYVVDFTRPQMCSTSSILVGEKSNEINRQNLKTAQLTLTARTSLLEQLEQRLHRPSTGWSPQPFQVRHGAAGPGRHEFLDETLHGIFGHVPPQIPMISQSDGLDDAANQHRNRARAGNRHIGSIQPFPEPLCWTPPFETVPIHTMPGALRGA